MTATHEAEFQELMDAWSEAIVADDPEAIGSFAEPDWMLVGKNGASPRDRFLDAVATVDSRTTRLSRAPRGPGPR